MVVGETDIVISKVDQHFELNLFFQVYALGEF
jgi:hypothetical protein